ncbi:ATP-dependent DNA helicase [Elysia marginata]|uniref:ATP-dependent DNA helicase n=1 Tax=Elysia marginata TaxID=1093978 RepID=A0AAV4GPR8_9GAST|nr:ATP-dependent DNA helicase [Elysia marginata]
MKKAEPIQCKSFELLVVTTISNQQMRFLTIYRPPPSKKNKLTFTMFKDEFQNFVMEKSLCGNLILIGDFIIHVENENDSQGKWLMELFDSLNLKQNIREPTHDGGHALDLLVTPKNNSFIKFLIKSKNVIFLITNLLISSSQQRNQSQAERHLNTARPKTLTSRLLKDPYLKQKFPRK